jgi:hypothetical protein
LRGGRTQYCLVCERKRRKRNRHDPHALHERFLSMTANVAPAVAGHAGNGAPLCI